MAKSLREIDGKRIIHNYMVQLLDKDAQNGRKYRIAVPPYRSVGINAKTDIAELTNSHGWLEKYVSS